MFTLEHIPPKSAGNSGWQKVEAQRVGGEGPTELDLSDGFALSVLCADCNSRLGSRLGTTFGSFVKQVQKSGKFVSTKGGVFVAAVEVFPARIFRQLLLNYLCVQLEPEKGQWDPIRSYIRGRERVVPDEAPRIGLYYNTSDNYRVVPVGVVGALGQNREPWMGAEIAAPGLGVVFTVGDPDIVNPNIMPRLYDISSWGRMPFSQNARIHIELARYKVDAPHPLAYGSRKMIDQWQTKNMIAWLASRFDTGINGEVAAVLWKPVRKR